MRIDVVILWVDGNDIEWQEQKKKYAKESGQDTSVNRYRDWGTLKYIFRSIEKYASWVNKVFLVTCGHFPDWINKECSKLRCISHEDFIPKQCLPTFSSQAIDLNLWRIEELSEYFIYFNDDMFLTDYVTPEDFFKNGLPCDMFSERPIFPGNKIFNYNMLNNINELTRYYNRRNVIRKNYKKILNPIYGKVFLYNFMWCCMPFKKFCGMYMNHLPMSYRKSKMKEVWDRNPKIFEATIKNKFRTFGDINQFIYNMDALMSGEFSPKNMEKQGKMFSITSENIQEICNTIKNEKYKRICINDECDSETFEKVCREIKESFEIILSNKSAFER